MSKLRKNEFVTGRPDARLSRRSLAASMAILGALGPAAASKALAGSRPFSPRWDGKGGGSGKDHGHPGPSHHCFLVGTRLLTPTGEVAVETLKIGDLLTTENGESRPIRWIGRREIARDARSGFPLDALPVRIARDTFGGGSPSRDLFVSGAHLLHLNGVLIAAASLINGTTIAQIAPGVALLRYFHVEFDRHDVVLAEGAPCDSLLASPASRRTFDNYEEYVGLYGDSTGETMVPYAPIASFNGGRSEFKSRLRSALAPVIDLRHPIDVVRDTLEARALTTKAA